jgi:uncharacterized membrane protein
MTGDFVLGGAVAIVEPLINSPGYFVHERVWDRLRRARGSPPSERRLSEAPPSTGPGI